MAEPEQDIGEKPAGESGSPVPNMVLKEDGAGGWGRLGQG